MYRLQAWTLSWLWSRAIWTCWLWTITTNIVFLGENASSTGNCWPWKRTMCCYWSGTVPCFWAKAIYWFWPRTLFGLNRSHINVLCVYRSNVLPLDRGSVMISNKHSVPIGETIWQPDWYDIQTGFVDWLARSTDWIDYWPGTCKRLINPHLLGGSISGCSLKNQYFVT